MPLDWYVPRTLLWADPPGAGRVINIGPGPAPIELSRLWDGVALWVMTPCWLDCEACFTPTKPGPAGRPRGTPPHRRAR